MSLTDSMIWGKGLQSSAPRRGFLPLPTRCISSKSGSTVCSTGSAPVKAIAAGVSEIAKVCANYGPSDCHELVNITYVISKNITGDTNQDNLFAILYGSQ